MIKQVLKRIRSLLYNGNVNRFHDYPFGREPLAHKEAYLEIWYKAKDCMYPIVDQFEKDNGFALDSHWLHELALHTQVVIKESEICYQHGRLLYTALSNYLQKNNYSSLNILETGTARGFSSLCMTRALLDREREGKIVTLDPLPHNVKMYWNCVDDFEEAKTRAQLLRNYSDLIDRYIWFMEGKSEEVLPKLGLPRIHFSFLDGAHDYQSVKFEISYVVPRQKKGDIIFFDDFQESYFPGIVKAVRELESKGHYKVNTLSVNDQRGYAIAKKIL